MKLNPNKTAILIVDIQNDFCHEKGVFAKQGLNVNNAQRITPKLVRFIEKAREKHLLIIYSKQIESNKVSPKNLKIQFKSRKLVTVCQPRSWGSELYKIKSKRNEYIIEKYTYDVFSNPKTNIILKKNEINTLIIAGVNTDICIDTTVRSAFTRGYNIVIPRDLVATINPKTQKHFLAIFDKFFGTVMKSKEIIKALEK